MKQAKTHALQYPEQLSLRDTKGFARLGLATNFMWQEDPRHLLFLLARYKFVAKMLSGKQKVLEVGCGDAFGTRLVLQEVGSVCAVDVEPVFVEDIIERMDEDWKFDCRAHDILSGPMDKKFDAAYSLDVIEHIPEADESRFMANITCSLKDNSVFIIGTPSFQSQAFACEENKKGHINCKDHKTLKKLIFNYFYNVFIFSMNDEVVHTGFYPMAHYLLAVGIGKRS